MGRMNSALRMLNTDEFSPMPSVNERTATAVNPGVFRRMRTA
jgi:hypothetical protein